MMEQAVNIPTLIFFGLAVFVAWRLWLVLGQKTGQERPPVEPAQRQMPGTAKDGQGGVDRVSRPNDVQTVRNDINDPDRWKGIAEPGSAVAKGLDDIIRIESSFDAKGFREGAKSAYEMIVMAFASGDRETLKNLLSNEVFSGFQAAITEREAKGEKVENTFVSMDKADITDVTVNGKTANVTFNFVSQLISVTRNKEGAVIDGSPGDIVEVSDRWTFSRDLGANDPNWLLVETEEG